MRNGVDGLDSHVWIGGECDKRLARAAVLFDLLRSSVSKLDVDAFQLVKEFKIVILTNN